jgi:hypothetical protein
MKAIETEQAEMKNGFADDQWTSGSRPGPPGRLSGGLLAAWGRGTLFAVYGLSWTINSASRS